MTKIDELIESIIKCEEFTMGYDDVCWPDDVKRVMQEYAEHYAKQVLELAAKNAKLDTEVFEGEMWCAVNKDSILNIELPTH